MSLHQTPLPVESRLPGFDGAAGWLNSEPLTPQGLRGRVVLVDFWTYTCINWLRTLGYLRAWAEKYKDDGLVVVGVHTPEFPFEQDAENVRRAVRDLRVTYPVALDPGYAVWSAFANHYWPAVYAADADGRIRYHHFGEEAYEETERVIQQLLRKAGSEGVPTDLVPVVPVGVEQGADWEHLESPETYLGSEQGAGRVDCADDLELNRWTLTGEWGIEQRASVLLAPGGTIAFRYRARDVNLVLRSRSGEAVPFRVQVDGEAPGPAGGLDVDAVGEGVLAEPRLYQLVRGPGEVREHTFQIAFGAAGVEAYVFTFG